MKTTLSLKSSTFSVLRICAIIFTVLLTSGCEPIESTAITPVDCMLISSSDLNGREVFQIGQAFAESRQLQSDLSHPSSQRHFIDDGDSNVGEISLNLGLGELGVELALWVFDDRFQDMITSEFELFTGILKQYGYELTSCRSVEYQGPTRLIPKKN